MNFKKILITGALGFVGSNVRQHLTKLGYAVKGIDLVALDDIIVCDVSNSIQLSTILQQEAPDVIIHCAARKNLPDCESFKAESFAANCLSTETIAAFAKQNGTKVIYISSDVVFDGTRGNYKSTDAVCPINWYGKTKVFSEVILKSVKNVAICRTALVIGPLSHEYKSLLEVESNNEILVNQTLLPQYIFQRLKDQKIVRLPAVMKSNPTPINLLCEILSEIIKTDARGIFHTAGPDAVSREEIGLLIARAFSFDCRLILRDDSNISPLRPMNISMDSEATFNALNISPAKWALKSYLEDRALYV